jgi:hypothetical protein
MSGLQAEGAMNDEELIGLDVDEAIDLIAEAGLKHRIEYEDGQPYMLTMDFRMDRINLSIEKGKVIKTRRG